MKRLKEESSKSDNVSDKLSSCSRLSTYYTVGFGHQIAKRNSLIGIVDQVGTDIQTI